MSLREGGDLLQRFRIRLAEAPKQEAMSDERFDLVPLLFVGTLWRPKFACQADAWAAALRAR
ncbi:hypothetical protein [Bradyrhizobium sp. USDA 4011]